MGAILPRPLYAAASTTETTRAVLGFIALTDSAPLIVAREKGFFAKYGMPDVEVVKQASWGTTRDNRPRNRLELIANTHYIASRARVLEFLTRKSHYVEAA